MYLEYRECRTNKYLEYGKCRTCLLADTVLAHKLLGDAHGVAVEQLAEEGPKGGAVRQRQQAVLELLDQPGC
jgi:hypothetical protein